MMEKHIIGMLLLKMILEELQNLLLFTFNTLDMQKDMVFNYPNPFKKGQKTNIVFYSDTDGVAEIYICSLFGNVLFKDTISVYKGSNIYEYDGSG
jgi:hypothetical protein